MTKAILNWNGKVEISNDKTLRIKIPSEMEVAPRYNC